MEVYKEIFENIYLVFMTKLDIFGYSVRLYDICVFLILSSIGLLILKLLFD